jgi:uncharacterized membrane protein YheB (UPF0754 family)
MTEKICKIEPKRAIIPENGSDVIYVLPCGVKYTEKHEVHCSKYEDRTCEYMVLKHIKKQQEEVETIVDEIIKDFYGGC